ncbi:YndE [Bacillus spizizenii TU-B-10]|uniref:YndE n=1 Tax=Bacillus spizizenii (strain DSM 15029 / JCM 12233 / NBRC 101239 / NRRL B-23049 / TU-B-10) TaxID=1052585 RepID=G4NXH2_BACS4|nr:YndE [Bacillus spizizenii TU-B-10]
MLTPKNVNQVFQLGGPIGTSTFYLFGIVIPLLLLISETIMRNKNETTR